MLKEEGDEEWQTKGMKESAIEIGQAIDNDLKDFRWMWFIVAAESSKAATVQVVPVMVATHIELSAIQLPEQLSIHCLVMQLPFSLGTLHVLGLRAVLYKPMWVQTWKRESKNIYPGIENLALMLIKQIPALSIAGSCRSLKDFILSSDFEALVYVNHPDMSLNHIQYVTRHP
ncbi:hypothetical protein BU16DRAFT_557476 [Lophium mytilinum]|uniref:Uncharacterized protein n=1 Tax=Lophium mytilinum TaxID=390894 RepID=A0A6A6R2Y4_9PEZI|nr:hypothetical protein BU16DRAFT_557476 [Lophium mytilinum]